MGMAFGPFFSAVMNGVNFTIAGVTFNGLTNPGWIMFILWISMGLVIHFEFQVREKLARAIEGPSAGCPKIRFD